MERAPIEERMEARLAEVERRLALLEAPLSNEKILRCVQCGESYRESHNPDGICEFHLEPVGDSWSRTPGVFPCCKTKTKGCIRKAHSAVHHDRFPYSTYQTWFRDTLANDVEEMWVDLEHPDLASDNENALVQAQVGLLKNGVTIFARAGSKLKLYERTSLDTLQGGTVLAEDKCGQAGIARVVSDSSRRPAIVVSVKATSDSSPEVVTVVLNVAADDSNREVVKTVELDSSFKSSPSTLPLSVPPLPSISSWGPSLDVSDAPTVTVHRQQGSVLNGCTLSLQGDLEVSSSFYSRDGWFHQYLSGRLILMNPSSSPVLVSRIWAEYESSDGKWCESAPASSNTDDLIGVRVDAFQAHKCSVTCGIKVLGEPGGDNAARSRIHRSLPQPLKVRFHVDFADGGKLSIIGEKVNPKVELPTKEQMEKDHNVRILHWAVCDDVFSETRHFVYVYHDGDANSLVIRNSVNSSYVYSFSPLKLRRLGYRAGLAGETERRVDEMAHETPKASFACHALISPEGKVYAFKFTLGTISGESVTYHPISPCWVCETEPSGELRILTHQPFRPSQLVDVRWTFQRPLTSSDWIAVFKRFAPRHSHDYIGDSVYIKGGSEGTAQLRLPVQKAAYELRLISRGNVLARSSLFSLP